MKKEKEKIYSFVFDKACFDYEKVGPGPYDFRHKSVSSTYLFRVIMKCATKNNCEVISFNEINHIFERQEIKIKTYKSQFLTFCNDFCQEIGNYITNIQIS